MPILALAAARLLEFYILLIFVSVLGSWFPQWRYQEWFRIVSSVVDPYLNLFRGLRLQAGMVDFTPMAAIFLLSLLRQALIAAVGGPLL